MKSKLFKISTLVVSFLFCMICLFGCSGSSLLKKVSKNLSTYNISAVYDAGEKRLNATEVIHFVNSNHVSLSEVCLNFYARAFREDSLVKPYTSKNLAKVFPNGIDEGDGQIERVFLNGKQIPFSFANESMTAICVKFEKDLEPQKSVEISIDFSVSLANCTHRLGYFNGSVSLGNFFPILAVYQKGEFVTEPYHSTGDPFFSEIANFNVEIEFPKQYEIVSTGVVQKEQINENNKIYSLSACAVRDFAISLVEKCKTISKTIGKTQISYTGYQNDVDFEQNLQTAIDSFSFYCETFGDYPYEKLSVVKAPFVHGGMEYPCMVVVSDSISGEFEKAKVIAHEIAHQWWYGLVGNNQIDEAWLDESLAEYSSVLFFEKHGEFGETYQNLVDEALSVYALYSDIATSSLGNLKTSMLLSVDEYNSEYEYSYMIYVKGILMFDALREVVGKKKLFKCFEEYFKAYRFKISSTDLLISSFKKSSRRDIGGFFDSWLQGKTVIKAM